MDSVHGRGPAGLSDAQRRAISSADPVTGEVKANAATLAALRRKELAVASGRIGAVYLTAAGRQVRQDLEASTHHPPVTSAAVSADELSGRAEQFTAATGDEPATAGTADGRRAARRAEEVARAWAGLLEVRRVSGTGLTIPAAWERARPVQAVALVLEAAGLPLSARDASGRPVRPGYRVSPGDRAGEVRVDWQAPPGVSRADRRQQLAACASELARWGWPAEEYADRTSPFLLVSATNAR
ncbi:MAG TPA: hypothetical protein VLH10_27070 [Yinghuangia sp.]|nr:hypothetical protein [Yinghuangia sp.]